MFTSGKGNISRVEIEIFIKTVEKLAEMTARRRRSHLCWEALRDLLQMTGNWKKAPRGKPGNPNQKIVF